MIQLLNNIWTSFNSINPELVNIILIPAAFVEAYLFMQLFLIFFNVNATKKQKILYVVIMSSIGLINSNFVEPPFNVFINYSCILLLIKIVFKLNILKSILSLILSTFIFGILNILLQNPYMTTLNITFETFGNNPMYRTLFLIILYVLIGIICIALKKFKKINFSLDMFDILDKKTLRILYVNLFVGFLVVCIQLVVNTFYIDIVPIIISILSFILLISFFALSVYSVTRMIKLATTKRDLETAEEYNKSLEILYDKVKGFKHDFGNIVSTLDGYIQNNDMNGLKDYFEGVKKDCKITNNLSILNPRIINNPGIYSLLNNKYFKETNNGISF